MKEQIPLHRHSEMSDSGIFVKAVTRADVGHEPVGYAHRDDYYMFGIIVDGSLSCDVDFALRTLHKGEIHFIRPGQVHRFAGSEGFEGLMLMAGSSMVADRYKLIFEEASVNGTSVALDDAGLDELKALFQLIRATTGRGEDLQVSRSLVSAFVGIIAGYFKRACCRKDAYNSRHTDIVVRLNALLQSDIAVSHSPAFYAAKLHLSPAYLNEVVKNVTGWSAGKYIRNEIVLRAGRMLWHTDMPVKQIAAALGFDDSAYFSRLFAKATGQSPVKFRLKT